mmetsp:Transcript_18819/g.58550  ORF Transcript_18819/g.58550 Transcript_18819/m.58550 type:complete len:284 (-) Transcript_18819:457-1308(-)
MYLAVEENFLYPLMTFSTASRKSFSETVFLRARMANMPASVHTLRISAGVAFGQSRASSSQRMSRSQFIVLVAILKMSARALRSGRPNSTLRSSRPGRNSAGSSVSGRLVAASTLMLPRLSKPSSWLISSSMVRCTSLSPPAPSSNRAPPNESISSKNRMHAFLLRAIWKSSRTMRAPSPTYFCTSSEPDTRIKVQSVWCATARASSVLPVPGGPNSSTPFGCAMPRLSNSSGCLMGSSITSLISFTCLSKPPIMSYVESGTFSTFMRLTSGSTLDGSSRCSA